MARSGYRQTTIDLGNVGPIVVRCHLDGRVEVAAIEAFEDQRFWSLSDEDASDLRWALCGEEVEV